MCGRFVVVIPTEELRAIFDLVEQKYQVDASYNICPTQPVTVVRSTDEGNRLDLLKWGLVPSWSKDAKAASRMINARSESVSEKSSFRNAIKMQRCIVPVSGFYEWSHISGEKHPHYIQMSDSSPMFFAGIWEHWKSPEGELLETFSILTTEANRLISPLHDRMPVILPPSAFQLWLDRGMQNPHLLEHLYAPCPDDMLKYYRVPDLVNNPRFNSSACIAQV